MDTAKNERIGAIRWRRAPRAIPQRFESGISGTQSIRFLMTLLVGRPPPTCALVDSDLLLLAQPFPLKLPIQFLLGISIRLFSRNLAKVFLFYDFLPRLAADVPAAARVVAIATKEFYGCDGVSTLQHHEPAGNQDVWHYHLHVFPRYAGDQLCERIMEKERVPVSERVGYAERLRPVVERITQEGPNSM